MTFSDCVIVSIVRGCHLNSASAKLWIYGGVRDYRDQASEQGQYDPAPDGATVAVVSGIDGHGGIAQHGLRPGSRHGHVTAATLKGIADIP